MTSKIMRLYGAGGKWWVSLMIPLRPAFVFGVESLALGWGPLDFYEKNKLSNTKGVCWQVLVMLMATRNPARKPLEVGVLHPIIYKYLSCFTSKRWLALGFLKHQQYELICRRTSSPHLFLPLAIRFSSQNKKSHSPIPSHHGGPHKNITLKNRL